MPKREQKKETSQSSLNTIDGQMVMSIIHKPHTITRHMEGRIKDIMTLMETGDIVPITTDTIDIRSQKRFLHH